MLCLSFFVAILPVAISSPLAGWVESPGYPHGYDPHSKKEWERCAPSGHSISLTLTHLDIEDSYGCEDDALKIFSGRNLLHNLCGKMTFEMLSSFVNPSLISSPGGCLSLTFNADYSNVERHTGFRAFYSTHDVNECDLGTLCSHFCNNYIGGYLCSCPPGYFLNHDNHTCNVSCTEDRSGSLRGLVSAPGHPDPYPEDARCSYSLLVDAGLQLVLEFIGNFDVQAESNGECIDSVTVKTPSKTFGPFCGDERPGSFNTHSNKAVVLFSTDDTGLNAGFTLVYKVRNSVTVTCDTGLFVEHKYEQSFQSKCQINGVWSPVYKCQPVDCGHPDVDDPELSVVNPTQNTLYKSKIRWTCKSEYYKLEGDDVFTCDANGTWTSESGSSEMPKCVPVCGLTEKQVSSSGRIIGGKEANAGEIPWQLLIKSPRGGASLINDLWAITAAHVVEKQNAFVLYGGMVDGQDSNAEVMQSGEIFIHPGYQQGLDESERVSFDNDIALIKLSARVKLGPNVIPVCLPEEGEGTPLNDKMATVSGFGQWEKGKKSQKLRYEAVQEYTEEHCMNTPRTRANKQIVFSKNMFCAGQPGVDSCKGDSGGPVVQPILGSGKADDPYRLKGVVSWGPDCKDRAYKGYYTKVQNYLDWIRNTIKDN
ncbi:complement C1s subcomponent isoform X2 [Denticeps clupeoides]|uniref:complement C1s subcomponent isoform X2 n=1 Tax=Denticeps clupeoides TaxID=299321 RepID=UPI0010A2F74F|nr:complement C1s subcomponent-like isoform X2 [Denticeps clupeoides]